MANRINNMKYWKQQMEVKINVFIRKSDHWKHPREQEYDVREEIIKGSTQQEILDKFYKKNRRCDASYYNEFADTKWQNKLKEWYNSDDYKKRSFSLYYENSIID